MAIVGTLPRSNTKLTMHWNEKNGTKLGKSCAHQHDKCTFLVNKRCGQAGKSVKISWWEYH